MSSVFALIIINLHIIFIKIKEDEKLDLLRNILFAILAIIVIVDSLKLKGSEKILTSRDTCDTWSFALSWIIKLSSQKKSFLNLPFSQKKSLVLERCFDDLMSLKINISSG